VLERRASPLRASSLDRHAGGGRRGETRGQGQGRDTRPSTARIQREISAAAAAASQPQTAAVGRQHASARSLHRATDGFDGFNSLTNGRAGVAAVNANAAGAASDIGAGGRRGADGEEGGVRGGAQGFGALLSSYMASEREQSERSWARGEPEGSDQTFLRRQERAERAERAERDEKAERAILYSDQTAYEFQ